MNYFFKNKKKFLAFIILLFASNESFAKTVVGLGNIKAEVLPGTISTSEIDADLIYDDLYTMNSEAFQSKSKEKTINLTYKANTFVGIAYGNKVLSEKDNADNRKGFADVILKNTKEDKITAKVKIDRTGIYFDKNGNAEIKVVSVYLIEKNQPKGTYRGYYHMVISY